jgi:Eco57I restriction-modification methylase
MMKRGGFDVIIGNPPYVEYNKMRKDYSIKGYQTEICGNTYAFVVERTLELLQEVGKLGVIIPVASVCTDGYTLLQQVLEHAGNLVISNFNDRPSKLFDGLEHIRLSIILCNKTQNSRHTVYTTKYHKWQTDERSILFDKMTFIETTYFVRDGSIPKLGTLVERDILQKVSSQGKQLSLFVDKAGKHAIYYTRKLSNFVQILDFIPLIFDAAGDQRDPSELKSIPFSSKEVRDIFLALLNSSLFYWLLTIFSDCRNLNKRELYSTYFDVEHASHEIVELLSTLTDSLMCDFKRHSRMLEMRYESLGKMTIQCIYPRYSKSIIDGIDRVLAQHYCFTGQELDFIINYDIKYRMGRDNGDESEE